MCLLVLYYRVAEDAPVVVGANREEAYRRGGAPPRRLAGRLAALAGIDPVASGTWLGVNENGVLVAITNRPRSDPPARPRSRGLLVRDLLLGCISAAEAVAQAVAELERGTYAGCNLLCADAERAVVIQAGDWLRVRPLPPGLHVLTNGDMNDASDPRVNYTLSWLGERPAGSAAECVRELRRLCGHNGPAGEAICFRGPEGGTVSSTLVAVPEPPGPFTYLHAQGPPDRTPYEDYAPLLGPLHQPRRD